MELLLAKQIAPYLSGTAGVNLDYPDGNAQAWRPTTIYLNPRPDNVVVSWEPFQLVADLSTCHVYEVIRNEWEPYLPHGTGLASPHPARARSANALPPVVEFWSAAERVRDVLRYLALRKTDLKDICNVSRQTLYDWLGGRFEPEGEKASRLHDIHELALLVRKTGAPLRAAVLSQPLVGRKSFLDLLREPRLDMKTLRLAVATLARQSADRERRSARATFERLGLPPTDQAYERQSLEHNLRGLPGK